MAFTKCMKRVGTVGLGSGILNKQKFHFLFFIFYFEANKKHPASFVSYILPENMSLVEDWLRTESV